MKLIYRSTLTLLIAGSFYASAQQKGDSFSSAKSSKTANLTYVHAGVNGFASKTPSGGASGLLVDLMREFENYVSDEYGITITSTYVEATNKDFKLYLEEVRKSTGGVFGLSNTSMKEERKTLFKFSPAFLNNISVLISNKSFQTLSSMDQISSTFASKVGYGVPSTTNYDRLTALKSSNFQSMEIVNVTSSKDILENITTNQKAFGFSDIHYYLEYLEQGKPVKRHPIGDQVGDKFGIIMPLNSDWEPVLSEFLSDYIKTAKYREMVIRNLGKGALRMIAK